MIDELRIRQLPTSPGCYIFTNKIGEIIYIGKSKCLKNRVMQYFSRELGGKYARLLTEIYDLDYITAVTETDALILECMLIKIYKPRYNSQMKRNKRYPYIKIGVTAEYPPVYITDNKKHDENYEQFGCFYNLNDAERTVELLNVIWKTPLCGKEDFTRPHSACLNYHLKKCCAPCERFVDQVTYKNKIIEIIKCFKGHGAGITRRLNKEMHDAAAKLDFEKAASLRDTIGGLERLVKKLRHIDTDLENKDIFLFFRAYNESSFTLFFIKNSMTLAHLHFYNVLDKNKLLNFVIHTKKLKESGLKDHEKRNGKFLTLCLIEIYADKLYTHISGKLASAKIADKLEEEYLSW